MKKIIAFIILCFCYSSHAQSYYEICSWQVETRQGGLLFGISDTKDGADVVIYNFQEANAGSNHDISDHPVKYKFTIYPADKVDGNPVAKFQNYAGKSYTVLSAEVVKLSEVDKKKGIDLSFDNYIQVRDDNRDFVKELSGDQSYAKNNETNIQKIKYSSPEKKTPIVETEYSSPKKDIPVVETEYFYTSKNKLASTADTEYYYPDKETSTSTTDTEYSYPEKDTQIAEVEYSKNTTSFNETNTPTKSKRTLSSLTRVNKPYVDKESNYYTESEQSSSNQVVLWEVATRHDGLLFGVSSTKDQADAIMFDFQERNADTKYDITDHPAKYKTTSRLDKNSITNFKNLAKKEYKVISIDDIKSLKLIRSKGFDAAVDYYMDIRSADREFVTKRLSYIYNGFEKYRILPENTKYIANSK